MYLIMRKKEFFSLCRLLVILSCFIQTSVFLFIGEKCYEFDVLRSSISRPSSETSPRVFKFGAQLSPNVTEKRISDLEDKTHRLTDSVRSQKTELERRNELSELQNVLEERTREISRLGAVLEERDAALEELTAKVKAYEHEILFFNTPLNLTEERPEKVFEEYEIKPKTIKLFSLKTDQSSSGLLEFDNVSQAVEALMLPNHTPIQNPRGGDGIRRGLGLGYPLGPDRYDDGYQNGPGPGGYGDHYPDRYERYGLKGDAPFGRDAPHPPARAGFGPPIISQPSLGGPGQSAGQQGSVGMVYGLDGDKVNADKLFNLFCLYGNVVRIKFLKIKKGTAMIQMGDGLSVERSIQHLNNVNLFNGKLHLGFFKQAFLSDVVNPFTLPDMSPSFKDFMGSKNNRVINPAPTSKNKIQPPSKMKILMVVLLLCMYVCAILGLCTIFVKDRCKKLRSINKKPKIKGQYKPLILIDVNQEHMRQKEKVKERELREREREYERDREYEREKEREREKMKPAFEEDIVRKIKVEKKGPVSPPEPLTPQDHHISHQANGSPAESDRIHSVPTPEPVPPPHIDSKSFVIPNGPEEKNVKPWHSPQAASQPTGKKKKLDVKEVFNTDDDEDNNMGASRKRKLVPLDKLSLMTETAKGSYNITQDFPLDPNVPIEMHLNTLKCVDELGKTPLQMSDSQESLVGWPSVFQFRGAPLIPNMPLIGIRGLKNVAFTCWLNVCVQIMANQREFKTFSVENVYNNCFLDLTVSNGVLAAFTQTVKKIWSYRSDWVLDTSRIREAIQRRIPSMSPEVAQRLNVAFGLILHAMREEISTVRSRPILKRSYNAVRSLLGYQVTAPQPNANIITHIFNGVYMETVACLNVAACGVSETRPYHFYSWPLQIKTRASVNIVNLFMESIGVQQHEQRQCRQCSRAARRTVAMSNFPNCFVMTVGRVNREGQSLVRYTDPVRCPFDWTINTQSEAITYRLNSFVTEVLVPGVVNHVVTCVRHLDNQRWFEINDEVFREVNPSSFTFENLVLAMYSRV